jgi:hypothetical protein
MRVETFQRFLLFKTAVPILFIILGIMAVHRVAEALERARMERAV